MGEGEARTQTLTTDGPSKRAPETDTKGNHNPETAAQKMLSRETDEEQPRMAATEADAEPEADQIETGQIRDTDEG